MNADNTLSFATWQNFAIIIGGGTYIPKLKLYNLWYIYNDNGVIRETVGYLYKSRTTTAEKHVIDVWIRRPSIK